MRRYAQDDGPMSGLSPLKRAALLIAGAVLGIVVVGIVAAWVTRSRINEAEPPPPAQREPAPDMRADAAPPAPIRPA